MPKKFQNYFLINNLHVNNDFLNSSNTEKIFCIITDGDTKIKKNNRFNFIREILKFSFSQGEIKTKIINFINSEKILFSNETNLESLKENIYCTYIIFLNLQK